MGDRVKKATTEQKDIPFTICEREHFQGFYKVWLWEGRYCK